MRDYYNFDTNAFVPAGQRRPNPDKVRRRNAPRLRELNRRDLQRRKAQLQERQREFYTNPPSNPVLRKAALVELDMEASAIHEAEAALG